MEPLSRETHFKQLLNKLQWTNQDETTVNTTTIEEPSFQADEKEKSDMEVESFTQSTSHTYRDVVTKPYRPNSPLKTLKVQDTFNLDVELQTELARRADKTEEELQYLRSVITSLQAQYEDSQKQNIMLSHKVQHLEEEKAHMMSEATNIHSQTDIIKNMIDEALLQHLETVKSNPTEVDPIEANRLTSQHFDKVDNEIHALKEFVTQSINNVHDDRKVLANTVEKLSCQIGEINKGIVESQHCDKVDNEIHALKEFVTQSINNLHDDRKVLANTVVELSSQIGEINKGIVEMTAQSRQFKQVVQEEMINLTTQAMKQGLSLFSSRLMDEAKDTINSLSRKASPRLRKIARCQIRPQPRMAQTPIENADDTHVSLDSTPRRILHYEENGDGTPQEQIDIITKQDTDEYMIEQREMPVRLEAIQQKNSFHDDNYAHSK
jgi:hypothetical protein